MSGRVDQVKDIFDTIRVFVVDLDSMAFDGDAFFSFKVHVIEDLIHHFPVTDGIGGLKQSICQSRFTMIDMRNDAEIPDFFHRMGSAVKRLVILFIEMCKVSHFKYAYALEYHNTN